MHVKNESNRQLSVSFDHWGKDGDTSWFSIAHGKSESWDRSDERGFVMAVRLGGEEKPYYILSDSSIVIYDDRVTDDTKVIKPATDRYK